ncbi:MAG: hypothetical protein R3C44_24175 [Chloroflexota bacterium]
MTLSPKVPPSSEALPVEASVERQTDGSLLIQWTPSESGYVYLGLSPETIDRTTPLIQVPGDEHTVTTPSPDPAQRPFFL